MKHLAITLSCIALLLLSCKKDDDSGGSSKTSPTSVKATYLTLGKWQVTTYTVHPALDIFDDGHKITDIYKEFYEDCDRDDLYIFYKDGTGVVDEGGSKCDPDDDQTYDLFWEFRNNETVLSIGSDTAFINDDYNISQITTQKLVLTHDEEIEDDHGNVENYHFIVTFVHP